MSAVSKRVNLVAAVLVLVVPTLARGQVQLGDNTSMNLNGNISFGYTADYSNYAGSSHSLSPSGNADLSGFYYSPNFLSFDVSPFYNETSANSTYQSVFQTGGVNSRASIFSGSHFPGTVSYSKVYNSEGGLTIPGVGNLTTKGNSSNLALGWGIQVPDYPKVQVQFLDGNNSSTVFGTTQPSSFNTKNLGAQVTDTLAGFNLTGGYQFNKTHDVLPEFLAGTGPSISDSSGNSFNVGVGHALPFRGSSSVSFNRADFNSEDVSSGDKFNGTIDTINAGTGFEPIQNLEVGANAQYTDNLTGMLYQSLIQTGAVLPSTLTNFSTHSLDVNEHGNYLLPSLHLTFSANADHREQTILGTNLSANTFNESASYGNELLGGYINATTGVTQTTVSANISSSSLGLFENVLYQRQVKQWTLTGGYNYSRNSQTLLIGYTTSGHGYSAGIGRKFNAHTYWSANVVGSKSSFNNIAGSNSDSQSYSSSLTLRRFSVSGTYARASGMSILTANGLVPVSSGTPILSTLPAVVFNGKSYSFGASMNPIHGLVLSSTYSKARSETESNSLNSQNSTAQLNGLLQYKVRQLWIMGGYVRLQQGFSITGQPPTSYSSFFIGITRWFKFF